MKVSVVIPVYNVEKYVEESLRSVMCQTLTDIQIICNLCFIAHRSFPEAFFFLPPIW